MEKDSRTGSPPMPVRVAVLLSRSTRIHRCVLLVIRAMLRVRVRVRVRVTSGVGYGQG